MAKAKTARRLDNVLFRQWGNSPAYSCVGVASQLPKSLESKVAQFREQFVKADTDGSGWLNDTQVGDIFKGMKLSLEQSAVLNEALEDAPASKEAMDFAGFLRLVGVIAKKGKLVL
ncbi:unnamed protein product [Symbiodinium microadriaticum]|nr:unnamed protein product [Symbiodinium microadriaticum]